MFSYFSLIFLAEGGPLNVPLICCILSFVFVQPYSEHLNGQKHKKKENAVKSMASKTPQASIPGATVVSTNTNQLYCQLCDVACGSAMTYESHVNGAKHLRVSGTGVGVVFIFNMVTCIYTRPGRVFFNKTERR